MFVGSRQRKTLKSSKSFASRYVFWSNTYNFLNKGGWQLANPAALISTLENSQMKKTLIAMAAVAVAGVASAQTITGEYGFGWVSDKAATKNNGAAVAGTKKSGLAQTDGSISISATEDLGGGMSLSGSTTVDLKGRTSVNAENASLTVSGGFGSVTLGSVEAGNGILGLGGAGAAGRGLDNGTALDGGTNGDMLKYTTPELMTGMTASITRFEAGTGAGDGAAQVTVVGVNFASGALTVAADTSNYAQPAAKAITTALTGLCSDGSTPAAGTACAAGTTVITNGVATATEAEVLAKQADQRQRISFSYDLGMAKVGYGYQKKSYNGTGKDNTQTVMGVNVPAGALSIGVAMSTNQTDGSAKTKGSDFSVNYALSKRTSLNFSNMRVKADGGVADTFQRLRLKTTF